MSSRPRPQSPGMPHVLAHGSLREARRIAEVLRTETIGGVLLLLATAVALVWANSPRSERYADFVSTKIGPEALHLHLSLTQWTGDGLLAIFFFVAGLELKREFVAGDLRDPRVASVPVAAALGGVLVPAVIYLAMTSGTDLRDGWAIPTATDIAFALAVLAVIGSALPAALRTFLLTLAVVDDLIAIVIIACFYTSHLDFLLLLLALVPLATFALLVQRRIHGLVAADPARCRNLGPGSRVRGPRNGRGCPAGAHRPGRLGQR